MDAHEIEAGMGVYSEFIQQFKDGDQRVVEVQVFTPVDVPKAFVETRAGQFALESLDLSDSSYDSIDDHFTDQKTHELLTLHNHSVFTNEDYPDFEARVPDILLDRDDIDNEDIVIRNYAYLIDEADLFG